MFTLWLTNIAGWNIPVFSRKYIDSIRGPHFPATASVSCSTEISCCVLLHEDPANLHGFLVGWISCTPRSPTNQFDNKKWIPDPRLCWRVEILGGAWNQPKTEKCYMGVSKNSGTPKWMVKIRENPIRIDDLGGKPLFWETPISSNWKSSPKVRGEFFFFLKLLPIDKSTEKLPQFPPARFRHPKRMAKKNLPTIHFQVRTVSFREGKSKEIILPWF